MRIPTAQVTCLKREEFVVVIRDEERGLERGAVVRVVRLECQDILVSKETFDERDHFLNLVGYKRTRRE